MGSIEHLNSQYLNLVEMLNVLRTADEKVRVEQNRIGETPLGKLAKSLDVLKRVSGQSEFSTFSLLRDTVAIAQQYVCCDDAVAEYQRVLLQANSRELPRVLGAVSKAQKEFDQLKVQYQQKYNYTISSVDTINVAIAGCTQGAVNSIQKETERLKSEAKAILEKENMTELRASDELIATDTLPLGLVVARYPLAKVSLQILKDLGVNNTYQNIASELRQQGNILIETPYERQNDEAIDAFVLAYILKVIEKFPLGSVNIHIFDRNISFLYRRLANSFQNENSGEITKRIIQLHTDMKDLEQLRDVTCEDIFKKTSVSNPDLYSVYENDKSDPFNIVILRDGLVDGSGYVSSEILDMTNALSKPGDVGHKCGLRFLVIDNSGSFEKNLTPNAKHVLGQIKKNCYVRLKYADGSFSEDGRKLEVLRIADNLESFVQSRAEKLAAAIDSKETNYVSISEVAVTTNEEKLGSIMYIPVGKSGNDIVELPLSCKDDNGTVAGRCIGYMAIGQSGSGKSSFFHSLVLNGCLKYSPKDLQFWLLDFKNGGASSKYSGSGLPHIKMIAENNKIDDALCLFQMVLEEMERRSKIFNRNFADNIVDYNRIAEEKGLEYFPRIIIAIDEVQEIFREDSASVLQKLISSISSRMRSAGMHFVMVAQNLSDGKSYMLKDAFLPSATGRICFRVAADIPRDSGFEDEFVQRKHEITDLKTGEAYVSYGRDSIKKVKMAFTSPQEMGDTYFAEIRRKYPEYAEMKPLVIGSKKRLSVNSTLQGVQKPYFDVIRNVKSHQGVCTAVVGEDAYRMSPLEIRFSQHVNSSTLFLGNDKQIASSLCASVVCSLLRQNVEVHLFNGDRTRVQEEYEAVQHAFMYVCQNIGNTSRLIQNHRLNELKDVMKSIYSEYLKRQSLVQMADDEDPTFDPLFIIVNDLFAVESFVSNEMVEGGETTVSSAPEKTAGFNFNFDIFSAPSASPNSTSGQFRENLQNIMSTIVKNGWRYNIHAVLAIKGDPSTWRSSRIASEVSSVILFNQTEYAAQFDNSYYLKEMLKNVSNDGENETMAVLSGRQKNYSKVRPIIYKLSDYQEMSMLERLVRGE